MLLGWAAFDAFAALGSWGRLVGFAVAWPYFGVMNSRLGGGQTLGKRLLGLRTVSLDGALLSPARGFLRSAVVSLPWFLNGAVADPDLLQWLPLVMRRFISASSAEKGSSRYRISGLTMKARASSTRLSTPPDSSCG